MTCNIQSVLISHSIVTVHLKKIMRSNLGLIMNFYFLQILLFKLVLAFLMHWSVAIPNRVMSPKMKDLSLVHTTLWICCNLQQTVVLWVIRKFSNYSQHNLALCDSHSDWQLVWMRLKGALDQRPPWWQAVGPDCAIFESSWWQIFLKK